MSLRPLLYFAGAIRASRVDAGVYVALMERLSAHAQLLTEHVADPETAERGMTDWEIFDRDVARLHQADAVVAEVTQPSLGVGYELGRAHAMAKPVLCLFRANGRRILSAMLTGNDAFKIVYYRDVDDAVSTVHQWLHGLELV